MGRDGACRKESILVIISNNSKPRALVCGCVRFFHDHVLVIGPLLRPVGLSHRSCPRTTVSFQRYLVFCSSRVLLTPRNGVPFAVTQALSRSLSGSPRSTKSALSSRRAPARLDYIVAARAVNGPTRTPDYHDPIRSILQDLVVIR